MAPNVESKMLFFPGKTPGPEDPLRRKALRDLVIIGGGAALVLTGCIRGTSPTSTPTETPPPTRISIETSTPTLEPTPTPELKPTFTPALLSKEDAMRFIAGGEFMSEEELGVLYQGRSFEVKIPGANHPAFKIILSQAALDTFVPDLMDPRPKRLGENLLYPPSPQQNISPEKLAETLKNTIWAEILGEVIKQEKNTEGNFFVFTYDAEGNPVVINLQDDLADWEERIRWTSLRNKDIQRAVVFRYKNKQLEVVKIRFPKPNETQYDPQLHIQWHDIFGLVAHNGSQIFYVWDGKENRYGRGWKITPPHQRVDDIYNVVPPECKIEAIIKEAIIKYDGETYGLVNPDGSVNEEAFKVLYDHEGNPQVLVLVNNGSNQFGLSERTVSVLEKAWLRLLEVDPIMAKIITNVYGLKIIGGNIQGVFNAGPTRSYLSTYSPSEGVIMINEDHLLPTIADILSIILTEARAIGYDRGLSDDPGREYYFRRFDPNNVGLDKAAFLKMWVEENRKRLTSYEIDVMLLSVHSIEGWYRENYNR